MSKCTNPKIGTMLHAYELKALNNDDLERFELHILECDYCFNELTSFNDEAALLLNDIQVKQTVKSNVLAGESSDNERKSLWGYLWPSEPPILFKPAISYAFTILVIVLFPLLVENGLNNDIGEIQSLGLMNTRSAGEPVLYKGQSNNAIINFFISDYIDNSGITLRILDSSGKPIYNDGNFTGIDKTGIGRLYLPLSRLSPGRYILEITLENPNPENDIISYDFTIE